MKAAAKRKIAASFKPGDKVRWWPLSMPLGLYTPSAQPFTKGVVGVVLEVHPEWLIVDAACVGKARLKVYFDRRGIRKTSDAGEASGPVKKE